MNTRPVGVRLAVLDDGQFARTRDGATHPLAATFHRYVETVARVGQFSRTRYIVPVRQLKSDAPAPILGPVDSDVLEIVPTAPFSGIADYLVRAPYLTLRNWRPIRSALSDSDLLWLRLPASNALLAMAAVRRGRTPYFGWLAGSVAAVADARQRRAPLNWAAHLVGTGYDSISELAGRGGPLIRLDDEMFSSIVTDDEVSMTRMSVAPQDSEPWRIVWAGRMASEKGLAELISAMTLLLQDGRDVTLMLIGDGPGRPEVQAALRELPTGRVTLTGHIGDRQIYLDHLRDKHVFVHPSSAEGVPKVLVEAMAAGVPIIASEAGAVAALLGNGLRGRVIVGGDARALAATIGELLDDAELRSTVRRNGLDWAAEHTADAQARRLINWLHERFPSLPWQA